MIIIIININILLIINITLFSILIGLNSSYFPLIHLPICVIRNFVIGQFNKPITLNCSLHQPIPTLVSVIIETVYRLLNWGFLLNGKVFSFNNNNILDDSDDLIYTIAEMFMLTIQTSSFAVSSFEGKFFVSSNSVS